MSAGYWLLLWNIFSSSAKSLRKKPEILKLFSRKTKISSVFFSQICNESYEKLDGSKSYRLIHEVYNFITFLRLRLLIAYWKIEKFFVLRLNMIKSFFTTSLWFIAIYCLINWSGMKLYVSPRRLYLLFTRESWTSLGKRFSWHQMFTQWTAEK